MLPQGAKLNFDSFIQGKYGSHNTDCEQKSITTVPSVIVNKGLLKD